MEVNEEARVGIAEHTRYNQRYPTFAPFIGVNFAYVRLHINLGLNLQYFGAFSSLDIGKFLSYSVDTVWTRFHEHRVLNAALASIQPGAVVTCLLVVVFQAVAVLAQVIPII